MNLRIKILTVALLGLISCKETAPRVNIDLIKNRSQQQLNAIDAEKIEFDSINEVDSLTYSLLPQRYQYLGGDDKMHFYLFKENQSSYVFSTLAESQFGLFFNLFLVSKTENKIIDDYSLNIDGSEGGWYGNKKGKIELNGITFNSADTIYEPLNDSVLSTTIINKTFKILFEESKFERQLIDSTNKYFEEKIKK